MQPRTSSLPVRRLLLWLLPALVLVTVLALLFRSRAELVDLAEVQRMPMQVTIDEEGMTRTREVFTVAAPVSGRLLRPSLKEGDVVTAGKTVVAEIEPSDPAFLDPRTMAESEAARDGAAAALALAKAELKKARAEQAFAVSEVARARELFRKGTVPRQHVDDAERAVQSAEALVEAAEASVNVRQFDLDRAKARLITPADAIEGRHPCACVTVRSPVNGRVLRVLHKSEIVVSAGTPLIEVGDPRDLEIVADLLSDDAVKVRPGQRVIIERWGGEAPLNATVRLVEPLAFTKVSALGISEQRVNVIMDLDDPVNKRPSLGHAYRVFARVVTWEADDVVTVPLTALFPRGAGWAVFVDANGIAERRDVRTGHRSGLTVEVLEGLTPGEHIVRHPHDGLAPGVRLRTR